MVHTIALETGEWEAEAAEVFLVLRLENATHKFTLETSRGRKRTSRRSRGSRQGLASTIDLCLPH